MLWRSAAILLITLANAACGGGGAGDSGSGPPAPAVSLSATPASVVSGTGATLTWDATDATGCTASGGWTGAKDPSGSESTGGLTASTSYTLTCNGAGGTAAETATVTVTAPPPPPPPPLPTLSLSIAPTTITAGGSATLTWDSTNATGCTASGAWSGSKLVSGTQGTGALAGNASYTLTCTGAAGSVNETVSVTVNPVIGVPAVNLSANPSNVATGAAATLNWSSTNATGCEASDGWTGPKGTSGSQSTGNLTATTAYTLACDGPGGSAGQSVTVTVTPPPPTVTFSASPTTVASGAAATLTWSTTNAAGCTASGGWTGAKATSGSQSTGNLAATTTYTLACTGAGGSASQSVTVTVTPPPPTVTFSANPATVASGTASTLTWSTSNATGCTASGGWTGARGTTGSESTGNLTVTTTYTLSCNGAGGITIRSATVTVTTGGGSSIFPLRVEAGKRYLVDALGQPFLMHGDTPWTLITQLTETEVDQYLEDRRAKGFNTILIELIENFYSDNAPLNVFGDAPFATGADFATRNEAYFGHAEYVIARAREKGMLVLITPAYLGFNGGSQGWYQEMGQAGNTVLQDYGRYVATRFQAYDNILWVHGGDYNPPDRTRMRAIVNGILEIETTRLHTFHGDRGTAALEWLGASETWLDVNNIYTDDDTVIAEAQGEYNRSTMPFLLIEGRYENESSTTPTQVRQQAWQAVLSGATGQLMGEELIWPFATNWPSRLDTEGASTLIHLRTLLESYAWWTLEPDFTNAFLTGGVGTGGGRAPAAVAADGSFAIVYVNTVRTLTVDLAALSGAEVQARWYDPTNGSFAAIAGSPFAVAGSQAFTPTGTNSRGKTDWVLVLDAIP